MKNDITNPKDYTIGNIKIQSDSLLWSLEKLILNTVDFNELVKSIVDGMLYDLGYLDHGYRIVVLSLFNQYTKTLDRVAISSTDEAKKTLKLTPIPFSKITIPIESKENILVQAYNSREVKITDSMYDILLPVFNREQAHLIQNAVGLRTIIAFPLISQEKVIGVLSFSLTKHRDEVTEGELSLLRRFTDLAALAVQNATLFKKLNERQNSLRKANLRLRELDKLKDEFVSITSHELRTPLTIIKNYLWLALHGEKGVKNEELPHYIDVSLSAVDRLMALVEDTLTISRIEGKKIALSLEKTDVISLVREIVEEYKIKFEEKKIRMEFNSSLQKKELVIDKNRMRQVLVNLLGNAIKFTPEKGVISITIGEDTDQNKFEIRVSDTGPGIPKEKQSKLFSKFGKIDESYANLPNVNGTGLGLYISQQIMELHGGKLSVESEYGHGATFIITLPIQTRST